MAKKKSTKAKRPAAPAKDKPARTTKTAAGEVKPDLIRRRIRGRICLIPQV